MPQSTNATMQNTKATTPVDHRSKYGVSAGDGLVMGLNAARSVCFFGSLVPMVLMPVPPISQRAAPVARESTSGSRLRIHRVRQRSTTSDRSFPGYRKAGLRPSHPENSRADG